MSGNNLWRIFLSVIAIGTAIYFSVVKDPSLGLDLEGGTQIVLDLKPRPGQELNADVANSTLNILRRRVDSLGVTEPTLELAGNSRIIIELPGVEDPAQARQVVGSTAQLTFHPVLAVVGQQAPTPPTTTPVADAGSTTVPGAAQPATTEPGTVAPETPTTVPASPSTTAAGLGADPNAGNPLGQAVQQDTVTTTPVVTATSAPPANEAATAAIPTTDQSGAITVPDDTGLLLSLGPSQLDGNGVETATAETDPANGQWYININFRGEGASAWSRLTGAAACNPLGDPKRQVAIVLDNEIISHPEVSASGASPVQCNVGIQGGTTSITGDFTQAEAKNLALLIRGGALPVDVAFASEQVIGPQLGDAAIEDSICAVIIGGIITMIFILLYYRLLGLVATVALAAYTVISYAVFVVLGLTLTLPGIAAFVLAVAMAMDSNVLVYERVKEEFAAGRSMRSAARMGFKNALSAIIDSNATTLLAAFTLFFLAVGSVRGFGVSLVVGTIVSIFVTLVILRTLVEGLLSTEFLRRHPKALGMYVAAGFRRRMAENPPNVMKLSRWFVALSAVFIVFSLAGMFGKNITYGIEFTGGRLLEYDTAQAVNLDVARERMADLDLPRAVVQRSGTDDVSIRVPELTPEQTEAVRAMVAELGGGDARILRDETIGPSFGDELKNKAMIGLGIGVLIQLTWVAIRFRWTFGIGAVLGMIHDAVILVGLFAWLDKPFDAVFLASLLTIIAFSVNDSVVVFDRIREHRRRRSDEKFADVVSDACAQTFPRTLNISLAALCILVPLYFLGGQTLHDFALALIIGIVFGIYSSIFIAAPVAVLLERWKPAVTPRTSSTSRTGARKSAAKAPAKVSAGKARAEEDEDDETSEDTGATAIKTPPRQGPRPRKKQKRKR